MHSIVYVQLDMLTKLDNASSPVYPEALLGLFDNYQSFLGS
jgi:hypothetical protein